MSDKINLTEYQIAKTLYKLINPTRSLEVVGLFINILNNYGIKP
ncbi:MAG: hypothetical protein ACFFA2_07445 [Promethearchaeota archaeon]